MQGPGAQHIFVSSADLGKRRKPNAGCDDKCQGEGSSGEGDERGEEVEKKKKKEEGRRRKKEEES